MSKQQDIRDYIKDVLDTAAIPGITQVYSSFNMPIQEEAGDLIVIRDESEEASEPVIGFKISERTISMVLEVYSETTEGDIDVLLDDYQEAIEAALRMDFSSNKEKPYHSLFYRGRKKEVASDGVQFIGGLEIRYEIKYDLILEP